MAWTLSVGAAVFALSAVCTGLMLRWLRGRAILDHPNARSSHAVPTPRGGGVAVILAILAGWLAAQIRWPEDGFYPLLAAALGLAVLSWLDDLRGLPAWLRLVGQAIAVLVAMPWLGFGGDVFQGLLPPVPALILSALVWLWFLNLFNFMDGIDGISAVEAGSVGLGLALVSGITAHGAMGPLPGLAVAAGAAGFAVWNWQPAKVFLGDVGSVPLGFLIGGLLLKLAADGYWAPALILPLYYLSDASITLVRRLARGARVWEAHREHFYQRAVAAGRSHAQVSLAVLAANLALIGLSLVALAQPWLALVGAGLVVAALLTWLARR